MIKKILKYIVIFFMFITVFAFLLTVMSSFSSKVLYKNVKKSSETLLNEGNRKIVYIPYRGTNMQFDNYTDALMINTAYSIDNNKPFESSFLARKNYIPNVTDDIYQDTAGELKSSSKYKYHNEVGELNDLVNGEKVESFEYARYWHGYLIILRPLLAFISLNEIRVIFTIMLISLAVILAYLLYKNINITVAVIFITGMLGIEYFYLGFSLQGIFVFLITVISSIYMLQRWNNIKDYNIYFFVIGILTNFFDFLTVPIVTLVVPLIIYSLLITRKNQKAITLRNILQYIFLFSINWGIGYAATWLCKWILMDMFFNRTMLKTALEQVMYRTNTLDNFNAFNVISVNMQYIYVSLFISLICTFTMININRKKYEFNFKYFNDEKKQLLILPYVILSVTPFFLYILLKNHSYYHAFFTYRNLLILVLCINLCIEEFLLKEEKND